MTLQDYFRVARRLWWVIALVTAVTVGIAAYTSSTAAPLYRSSAAIYVSPNGATPQELSQGTTFLTGQMESYADLAATSAVLTPVIEKLGLEQTPRQLARSVTASATSEKVILKINSVSTSPELAAKTAEATATSLSDRITELAPVRPDGEPSVKVAVVEQPLVPAVPFSPNTQRNLLAGLIAGLLLGYLLALLWTVLDTRLRTVAQVRESTKTPVLAEVPATRSTDLPGGSRGPYVEEFHRLRANLDFVHVGERPLLLVVTSAVSGEGKSTTALNLARTCAASGQRVLIIDADLRRPTLHTRLGLESSVGLSTVLAGRTALNESTLPVGRRQTLHLLPSGIVPPNPSELLNSPAMDSLLAQAKHDYDLVIIDTPPVLPVIDAVVMARKASGAILVTRIGKAHRDQLKDSIETLTTSGAELLGLVINGTPAPKKSPYHQETPTTPSKPANKKQRIGIGV